VVAFKKFRSENTLLGEPRDDPEPARWAPAGKSGDTPAWLDDMSENTTAVVPAPASPAIAPSQLSAFEDFRLIKAVRIGVR
jgi:hypothetical protein